MNDRWSVIIVAVAAMTLHTAIAQAAGTAAPVGPSEDGDDGGWRTAVGAGIAAAPDYEGSDDYIPEPLLFARVQKGARYLSLEGTTLRANLAPGSRLETGPLVRYRFSRGGVRNNRVDAFEHVDAALEVGGFVTLKLDPLSVGLEASQDIAGAHSGFQVLGKADYAADLTSVLSTRAGVFTTYASHDYMDTYFGVSGADARRSGLDRYEAGAGFKDVGLELGLTYTITEQWSLSAIGRYARLLGDAADSPIVDDEGSANQLFGGLSIGYRFTIGG